MVGKTFRHTLGTGSVLMAETLNTSSTLLNVRKKTVLKKSKIHSTKEAAQKESNKSDEEKMIDDLTEQIADYIMGE